MKGNTILLLFFEEHNQVAQIFITLQALVYFVELVERRAQTLL